MSCANCRHGKCVRSEAGGYTGEVICKHPVLEPKDAVVGFNDWCDEYELDEESA